MPTAMLPQAACSSPRSRRAYTLRIASISPSCGAPVGHPSKSLLSYQSHSASAESGRPRPSCHVPAIQVGRGARERTEPHQRGVPDVDDRACLQRSRRVATRSEQFGMQQVGVPQGRRATRPESRSSSSRLPIRRTVSRVQRRHGRAHRARAPARCPAAAHGQARLARSRTCACRSTGRATARCTGHSRCCSCISLVLSGPAEVQFGLAAAGRPSMRCAPASPILPAARCDTLVPLWRGSARAQFVLRECPSASRGARNPVSDLRSRLRWDSGAALSARAPPSRARSGHRCPAAGMACTVARRRPQSLPACQVMPRLAPARRVRNSPHHAMS